jgi:membrane-associated phospholipid phosphatase
MSETGTMAKGPALWQERMPRHFDLAVAWWIKALAVALAAVVAVLFIDQPLAAWAQAHAIADLMRDGKAKGGDVGRELMFLEQFGQLACSVVVIAAVALVDRAGGRRRALAVALACVLTLVVTHLLKDVCGRTRPFNGAVAGFGDGHWEWRGWWWGFHKGAPFGSFPSAHTTAAFALASSLAWFYPRGRGLFMTLALITATQRVLHHAHYLSDVIAGMGIGVFMARMTLGANLAGRIIAWGPPRAQAWWAGEPTRR